MTANEYREEFRGLNVNRNGGKIAPHKAILLLTVIELIEEGVITAPFVPLSDTLELRFKNMWNRHVPRDSRFRPNLNYPFFHLSSSPFWTLEKSSAYVERKEYTLKGLKGSFTGAQLPPDLFNHLKNPEFRKELRRILLTSYTTNLQDSIWKELGKALMMMLPVLSVI